MTKMNKLINYIIIFLLFGVFSSLIGCKKYLDINSDPDTPQFPDVSSVFPTQLSAIPRGLQYDARYVSKYIQNFQALAAADTWDRMGYLTASDANGDIWRQTYFGLGQNLNYIIETGVKNQQWDYVGAAYALKAAMFQYCTDYHGEIIFKEAFDQTDAQFKYDDQETVYKGIDSLCRLAVYYLSDTTLKLNPSQTRLSKGDFVYNGNVTKWLKYTYGILAQNFNRVSNKSTYNPDSVIFYSNKSFATVDDDFVIPFDASKNDDANFFGTYRNNLTSFRQSSYIVKLLDGTTLTGIPASSANAYNRDPRIKHMLSASHDTTNGNGGYRGVDAGLGDPNNSLNNWWTYPVNSSNYNNARRKVANLWGDTLYYNPSSAVFSTQYKKYVFGDKVVFPIMTASQIQFMKAEAAMKKGDRATAFAAYKSGINLHFDFINRSTYPRGNNALFTTNAISVAERTAYFSSDNVKKDQNTLTMADIMLQKYIALWGWGFFETWVDLRRYHYTDLDPATGTQVYLNFVIPSPLDGTNLNKPVYRARPRYNSEYVWNRDELAKFGGLNIDYHTYECWFSKP